MQSIDISTAFAVIAFSFAVAFAALWAIARFGTPKLNIPHQPEFDTAIVFLFEDSSLVDATDAAHHLHSQSPLEGSDFDQLVSVLSSSFPGLETRLPALSNHERLVIRSKTPGDLSILSAHFVNERLRIEISTPEHQEPIQVDSFSHAAMEQELRFLKTLSDNSPLLAWARNEDGRIIWANKAYLELAHIGHGADGPKPWPPRTLFEDDQRVVDKTVRLPLKNASTDSLHWYDVRTKAYEFGFFGFATEVGALVAAERSLKDFVQTLTQTFAHLSTGLAIFDRNRQLTLFNPALTDLTGLPFEFLSTRPTLVGFLDRLREKQMMPEPKDYKTWRQQLTELEAEAVKGSYEDLWTLPSGQTYRVSGRPHPDGAIAFLFSDITSEISLTRRFRAELEVGQAVVDAMVEGIAVFAPNGALTLSNAAFDDMWGLDPAGTLGEFSILDASRHWQNACEPSPVWGDIRDFVDTFAERTEWYGEVSLLSGSKLNCRIAPLAGGATLVGFTSEQAVPARSIPKELRISA